MPLRRYAFRFLIAVAAVSLVVYALVGERSAVTAVISPADGDYHQNEELDKLLPSYGSAGDNFGYSVAIDGDIAVIGVPFDNDNGSGSGSVYVFTRSGSIWSEQQKLTASDGEGLDEFGHSVAIDGNTVVVGAHNDGDRWDSGGLDSGSAYVFTRSGTNTRGWWSEQAKLTASDAATRDNFGTSVAIDGDTAVIGARYDDDNGKNKKSGSAYVFTRSGTSWSEQQKITDSDADYGHEFGHSVAIDGETIVIGVPGHSDEETLLTDDPEDSDDGYNSGAAYISP